MICGIIFCPLPIKKAPDYFLKKSYHVGNLRKMCKFQKIILHQGLKEGFIYPMTYCCPVSLCQLLPSLLFLCHIFMCLNFLFSILNAILPCHMTDSPALCSLQFTLFSSQNKGKILLATESNRSII